MAQFTHPHGVSRQGTGAARAGVGLLLLLFATFVLSLTSTAGGQDEDSFTQIEMSLLRDSRGAAHLPIEVRVLSERAIEGTLEVRSADQNLVLQFPLAMAANSELSQLVSVPATDAVALRSLTASLLVDGEAIDEAQIRNFDGPTDFAAGVLGLDVQQDVATLEPAIGTTSLIEVNDIRLLPALDIFVISPQGVASLRPAEQSQLLTWTGAGGQLAVADDPGTLDDLLPVEWQGSDQYVLAGAGEITYIGTDWSDSITPPTSTAVSERLARVNTGPDDLIEDGRFQVPSLRYLVLIVAVYVIVVGPFTIWYLNKMGRPRQAWLAIPSLALAFSLAVIVAGLISNDRRTDAYVSIVAVTPAGAEVTNTVLVTSTGTERFELASGWTLLANGDEGGAAGAGSELTVAHTRNASELTFEIETGSAGVAKVQGYVPDVDLPFAFDEVGIFDDTLRGEVTNTSEVALDDVLVLLDGNFTSIGRLEAGETTNFGVSLVDDAEQLFAPEVERWGRNAGLAFGDPNVNDEVEDNVNTAAWLSWRAEHIGASVPSGVLTVVGWSREIDEYSLVSGSGRTALVQYEALPEATEVAMTGQIRTQQPIIASGFDEFGQELGADASTTYIRPPGVSTDLLALSVPPSIESAAVWVGGEWRYLLLADEASTISIPEEGWEDDRLTVLVSQSGNARSLAEAEQRLVDRTPQTVEGLLAASGRVPQRQSLFSDFDLDEELPRPTVPADDSNDQASDGDAETVPEEAAEPEVAAEELPRHSTSFGRPSRADWSRDDSGILQQSFASYSTLFEPGDLLTVDMQSNQRVSYVQIVGPDGVVLVSNREEVLAGDASPISVEAAVWGVYDIEVRLLDSTTSDSFDITLQSTASDATEFEWTTQLSRPLVQRRVRFGEGDDVEFTVDSEALVEVTVFDPDWNAIAFANGSDFVAGNFLANQDGEYTIEVSAITDLENPVSLLTLALGGDVE